MRRKIAGRAGVGGLERINGLLEIIQPYLVDRVRSDTPLRFPEGTGDIPAFAKREAAFMLRRKAEHMISEGDRIDNPTNRILEKGKSKAFRAIADLLEALNIDVREELEREQLEEDEYPDDTDDDQDDDYIDVDQAETRRVNARRQRQRQHRSR